jgi:hypothetical protein
MGPAPWSTQAKPGSSLQLAEQPSPSVVLPSSHCSPDWTKPSPHAGIVVLVVDVVVVVVVVVVEVVGIMLVVEVVGIVLVVEVVGIVLVVEVVGTIVEVVGAVVVVDGIIVVLVLVVVVGGHGPTRGRHLRM